MKVGILTVHRAINMGAVLQCYALQEMLRSLGHEVWVINYVQEKIERSDREVYNLKLFLRLLIRGHIRSVFYFIGEKRKREIAYHNFDMFLQNNLNCTKKCNDKYIPQDFDDYVIGSDQLWNSKIFGYPENVFWGNFKHPVNSKLVAYAPSTTVDDLKRLSNSYLQSSLLNFNALSVREPSVAEYLTNNFHLDVKTVLDPTLAVNPNVWFSMPCNKYKNQKYILIYGARFYPLNPKILLEKAKILAKEMKCEIKQLGLYKNSPLDYLDLVRNASYVITSSFHGVAFSLIYNRPLYAVKYGDGQDGRYVDLLQTVGGGAFLVDTNFIPKYRVINYSTINQRLQKLRKHSIEYLKENI